MLEMVKQLTLATAPQQSAATSQRIGQDDRQAGLFEKLFGHADTAKTDKPDKPPRVEDDRPELSSGWDTADHATTVADHDDQAPNAAVPESPSQADQSPIDNGQDADPADPADSGFANAGNVQAKDGNQQSVLADNAAAQLPQFQLQAQPAETQTSPGQPSQPGTNQQTAEEATATNLLGGTPITASTDASGSAVLKESSAPAVGGDGQEIQVEIASDGQAEAQTAQIETDGEAPASAPSATAGEASSATDGEEPSAVIAKAPSGDDGEAPSAVIAKAPSGDDGEAPSATAEQNTPQSLTGVAHTPTERASQTEAPQPRAQTPTQQSGGELPVPDLQELAIKTVRWQRLDAFAQAGSARIRLSPPQLGTVEVMMHTSNNVVRVQMVVETEAVRQLLQAHSGRLTQNLLALGMNTQQLEIVVETPAELPYEQTEQQGGGQGRREGQAQQGPFSQDRSFAEQVEEEINLMA